MSTSELIIQLRTRANGFLAEAKALQEQAESLFQSAGILEEKVKAESNPALIGPRRVTSVVPLKPARAKRGTRVLQVRSALRFGPLQRADIAKATRIPKGTLDHILKEGGEFTRDAAGFWSIKPKADVNALAKKVSEIGQQSMQKVDLK